MPHLRQQILRFLTAFPSYRGLSLDFESLPDDATPAYTAFIQELYADLHSRNLRLYVRLRVGHRRQDFEDDCGELGRHRADEL